MLKKTLIIIVVIIITIGIIIGLLNINKVRFFIKYGDDYNIQFGVTKLIFSISEDTYIDSKSVIEKNSIFNLFNEDEVKKLKLFLSRNGFVIMPGTYSVKYNAAFEDIVDELSFKSK